MKVKFLETEIFKATLLIAEEANFNTEYMFDIDLKVESKETDNKTEDGNYNLIITCFHGFQQMVKSEKGEARKKEFYDMIIKDLKSHQPYELLFKIKYDDADRKTVKFKVLWDVESYLTYVEK